MNCGDVLKVICVESQRVEGEGLPVSQSTEPSSNSNTPTEDISQRKDEKMAENKGIELKTIESASAPVAELDSKYQSVDSPPPVVAWSNIEVRSFSILDRIKVLLGSKVEGKRILNGISGQIERGLWGILGASGSGKTTLLNVLGKREDFVRTTVTGTATLGGEIYQRRHLKAIAGYVLQDDVLHSQFTVYETLWFHSFLRLSGALSAETIKSRIEDALNLLQIDHTRNTIVGDTRRKGISGGERKRLAIALELIPRPKILFLDEPTSGKAPFVTTVQFLLFIFLFLILICPCSSC